MNLQLVNMQWCLNYAFPLHLVTIHKSAAHTRSLVHKHKYNNVTLYYLMMDLLFKERSGRAFAQDLVIHVIVYGILGPHNDVVLSLWDKKFQKLMTL